MHGHFLLQTLKSTDECIVSSLVSLVTVTSKVSNYFVILLLWGWRGEKLWEEEVAMVRDVPFCMPVLKWQCFGDQWWIRAKTKFDLFKFWMFWSVHLVWSHQDLSLLIVVSIFCKVCDTVLWGTWSLSFKTSSHLIFFQNRVP